MRSGNRKAAMIGMAVSLAVLFFALRPAEAFDRELVHSDYARLKQHLNEAYANLEWVTGHRGLDLKSLDEKTIKALEEANSAGAARKAIHAFVKTFQDPHFYARDLKPSMLKKLTSIVSTGEKDKINSTMSAKKACDFLGFNNRDLGFDLKFKNQPGYREVSSGDNNPFHAGILKLASGKKLGIIRIAHFGEDGYPDVCREMWDTHQEEIEEMCQDGWCGPFYFKTRDRILSYIEDRINQLGKLGYDTLVIDITGNGGGTDWVHATAEIVSPKELTCGKSSFVKHPHWTKITASMIEDAEADLKLEALPERTRRTVESARATLQDLHEQTKSPCDRSALWENSSVDLDCSNIVDGETFMCGLFPSLTAEDIQGVSNPELYYRALQNEYTPHLNKKPLVILIDGGTASASELFGSVIQDSKAGLLVGSKSFGAGCGFVNGGIPLTLEHVGLKVMAPDCIRFRTDGMNEIEGMQPDILVDWTRKDSAKLRTRKVLAALNSLE